MTSLPWALNSKVVGYACTLNSFIACDDGIADAQRLGELAQASHIVAVGGQPEYHHAIARTRQRLQCGHFLDARCTPSTGVFKR